MTDEDIRTMDSMRRDKDRDIREALRDNDATVTMVDWWKVLGFGGDMTVTETREMRILDYDGGEQMCYCFSLPQVSAYIWKAEAGGTCTQEKDRVSVFQNQCSTDTDWRPLKGCLNLLATMSVSVAKTLS
jgi:hypothetical protein